MESIYIISLSILIFIVGSLLIKRKKDNADHILIVWLLLAVFYEVGFYWLSVGAYRDHLQFFQLFFGTQLLHAPFLYFYMLALFKKDFTFNWKNLIHLTPLIFFYLLHLPGYSQNLQICSMSFGCFTCTKSCSLIYNISKMIINTFYLMLAFFAFKELRHNDSFHYKVKKRTLWARMLIVAAFGLNIIVIFYRLAEIAQIQPVAHVISFHHLHITISILIILFGFLFFNLDNILGFVTTLKKTGDRIAEGKQFISNVVEKANEVYPVESLGKNTQKTTYTIPDEKMEEYYFRIRKHMDDKQPYMDPRLTKGQLASQVGIPAHQLSIVLREKFQQTYNNFINLYRLRLLLDKLSQGENENYTLLSLAFECGFNSKSTFNRFFKDQLGVTPSEFLKTNPQDYSIRLA